MNSTPRKGPAPTREAVYRFYNEHGLPLFERIKLRFGDGSKIVTYQFGVGGEWATAHGLGRGIIMKRKHPNADRYLYHLPELLQGLSDGADVYWPEGESDCLALEGEDVVATSHHGGAGKVYPAQVEWFRGFRGRVILLRDSDPIGAYDAVLRLDLLRGAGVEGVEVRGPATGKDVRDHLTAGLGLSSLVPWPEEALREEAARVPRGSVYRYTLPRASAEKELALIEGLGADGSGWNVQCGRVRPATVERRRWHVRHMTREQWVRGG